MATPASQPARPRARPVRPLLEGTAPAPAPAPPAREPDPSARRPSICSRAARVAAPSGRANLADPEQARRAPGRRYRGRRPLGACRPPPALFQRPRPTLFRTPRAICHGGVRMRRPASSRARMSLFRRPRSLRARARAAPCALSQSIAARDHGRRTPDGVRGRAKPGGGARPQRGMQRGRPGARVRRRKAYSPHPARARSSGAHTRGVAAPHRTAGGVGRTATARANADCLGPRAAEAIAGDWLGWRGKCCIVASSRAFVVAQAISAIGQPCVDITEQLMLLGEDRGGTQRR